MTALEDICEVFQHGFGVKYARQLQKDAKLKSRNGESGDVSSLSEKV